MANFIVALAAPAVALAGPGISARLLRPIDLSRCGQVRQGIAVACGQPAVEAIDKLDAPSK